MCDAEFDESHLNVFSIIRIFAVCHSEMASSRLTRVASVTNGSSSCKVVLAGSIAKSLLEEVRDGLSRLDRKPQLHGFLANQDPAAKMYADWTAKTCKDKYACPDRI